MMRHDATKINIRPATADDVPGISRAHVRSWQSAYRGIVADSFLDALDPIAREGRWHEALELAPSEGRLVFVAELPAAAGVGFEIAGFASGGPEREGLVDGGVAYDGEIYALYLTPEYQRQGIGRRLVAAAGEWLIEHGSTAIVIWALQKNAPARAFYEALGGVLSREKAISIGPSELVDVAYCWPDARALVVSASGD